MVIGVTSACCCQPDAVSLANSTDPSSAPPALQMLPTWLPTSLLDFQNRIAVICPAISLVKRVPSSHNPSWNVSAAGTCVVNSVCVVTPTFDTVTDTDAVARLPAASRAIAHSVCAPLATVVLSHTMLYGLVSCGAPTFTPSTWNCTLATPTLSCAPAAIGTRPVTTLPGAG